MKWESPWSIGYPGWHTECAAMSKKYLGDTFDIHGGGMDNVFPHHESEIAIAVSANGVKFVNYFMHNNLVTVNGQKMGKSLGNTTNLEDLFTRYSPELVRLFIVKSHYRSILDFSEAQLEEAKITYDKFKMLLKNTDSAKDTDVSSAEYEDIDDIKLRFIEAMDNDLNTPVAIAVLLELVKQSNSTQDNLKLAYIRKIFEELAGEVLGLQFEKTNGSDEKTEELAEIIANLRDYLKENKQYDLTDKIRDMVLEKDIKIYDTKEGTKIEI